MLVKSRWILFFVLVALGMGSAVGSAEPEHPMNAFVGQWVFAGGDAELEGVSAAIDKTIASMSMLMRPIAKKRMHKSIKASERYDFSLDETDKVLMSWNEDMSQTLFLDGKWQSRTGADKKTTKVKSELVKGELHIAWNRDDANGWSKYRISADGRTLSVTRSINSGYFKVPVQFTTTYRRAE